MKQLSILVILIALLASCKTSEANYRAAYEKTKAASEEAQEETIYNAHRRNLSQQAVIAGGDTIPVVIERVSATVRDGEPQPEIKAYNVVAGRFKQKFNALSLRDRLADAGYSEAMVVQTAEPYYYIIVVTSDSPKDAKAAMERLKADEPISMSDPLPFILHDPRK